ncbi:hypothetical protein ACJMK2_003363 [Sinanodonta woodiana]|uniref:Uncharacterized protein n=1 Tax=Sinanodonta woodiana TaxID=1069815 RepID=A0ABD3Y1C2_SINWO
MLTISHIAVLCTCASVLFLILSIALPYWYYSVLVNFGLWTYCSGFGSCQSLLEVTASMQATRAFVIIGLLLLAGSGVVGFLKVFVLKEKTMFPRIAGGLAIAAGISIIIGVGIFGGKVGADTSVGTLHAGFGLAVVSGLTSFAAGGLYFASK